MRLATILLATSLIACRDKAASSDTATPATDSDGDGYAIADGDCDDADAATHPGADELCDEVDNDCDGTIDEDAAATFYADADGDGYGDPDDLVEACEPPSGYTAQGDDCDDGDSETYPGAAERCDEVDNDCDGTIDEDVQSVWYADADGDGFGDPDASIDDCDPPARYVSDDTDCDDLDADARPDGVEICDGADNDCDGDIDEDVTTTWYVDSDGDRYGVDVETTEACSQPTGYALSSGDCDDTASAINPSATELCDSIDNDCDGTIDEDDAADASTWYEDGDSDGYGSSTWTRACDQPTGYVDQGGDCDDGEEDASPGEAEVCDDIDNDCDGDTDEQSATDATTWYADADGDGYGSTVTTTACEAPSGYADQGGDCDDGEEDANPGESEVCDDIDNDCDGDTDEGLTSTYYIDYDGDGYGSTAYTTDACSAPTGYVSDGTDCDDTASAANPGASEVCDEVDNDCDGSTDEGVTTTWYADSDGDGYGDSSDTTAACSAPTGYTGGDGDCDDTDDSVYDGAAEICDGQYNDCSDSSYSASSAPSAELDGDGDGYVECDYDSAAWVGASVSGGDDCDDTEADAYPGNEEICLDGIDNDCDGTSDNGEPGTEECPAADCAEVLDEGATDDGVYWVDPTGSDPYEVYCDLTSEGGGWTVLAIFTNNDSVSWGYDDAGWATTGDFGAPTSPSTNADAKSQAFDDMPVDELMIVEYPSSLGVLTETDCVENVPLLEIFQTDSEDSNNCAYSCDIDTANAPWSGQSGQDDTLRMRCMDDDGETTAHGYTVSTDDNSMITTVKNDSSGEDDNFGLGAGMFGSTVDFDEDTDDNLDDDSTTQILLLGR